MRKYRAIPLLLALGLLFSCGLNNTMYNARKYFRSAQQRPLSTNGRPTAQAVDEYTKAIKKCGIIIANYKDSRLMDDALFLMAKALYLKGNSAFQAKDQFQALIVGFPNSPFVPEAHIYLAKVLREVNQPAEANKLLEDFVRDPKHRKDHPRALLTLAEFRILDKDYLGAQYWLGKIINEYPNTREYTEAFFLFGKNYYVQKDYATSLEEFQKLVNARGIDKLLKMEARYYMALNHLALGNYERAMRLAQGLLNDESRPDKLGSVRVLKARLLFATGKYDEAVTEVDAISKTYPRTAASAEAFYHLGDYHFYTRNNIGDASTAFNKVRTEFQTSELVAPAQQKVAALNQLNSNQNLSPITNLQQFVDYHMQAAENYSNLLALPDSARVMYDRLINARSPVRVERDSLAALQDSMKARLDSLDTVIATFAEEPKPEQEAETEPEPSPEESTETDSLDTDKKEPVEEEKDPTTAVSNAADQLRNDLANIETRIKDLEDILTRFDNEILPFAWFAKASLLHKQKANTAEVEDIYTLMQESFPRSKYTNALRSLINGEPIRLVDPEEERQEALLDKAFGMYPDQADSMRVILEELVNSRFSGISLRANFRLGWFHSYEVRDTTLAKPYLDKVLKDGQGSDQAILVNRFYDGKNYKVFTSLIEPVAVEPDSLKSVESDETGTTDDPETPSDDTILKPESGPEQPIEVPEASETPELPPVTTPEIPPSSPETPPEEDPNSEPSGGLELE
jgi:TolA-binding protein